MTEDTKKWRGDNPVCRRRMLSIVMSPMLLLFIVCLRVAAPTLAAPPDAERCVNEAGPKNEQNAGRQTPPKDAASQEGVAQEGQARILAATLALERGLNISEHGDPRRGLLWLARALQLAPANAAGLRRTIRANLAEWGHDVPTRFAYYPHPRKRGYAPPTMSVAVSSDGKLLATGVEQELQLWDLATGQQQGEPLDHVSTFWKALFSPDGTRLLTGGYINTPWQLWDVEKRKPVGQPLQRTQGSEFAVFSPDSEVVLTVTRKGVAALHNARNGEFLHELQLPAKINVSRAQVAVFSPDSKTVLAACSDNTARLADVATGRLRDIVLRHNSRIISVAFDVTGTRILTASADKSVRVWQTEDGSNAGRPWSHPVALTDLGLSANGSTAYTVGEDRVVRLWDPSSGSQLGQTAAHPNGIRHISLSHDGGTLVTCEYGNLANTVRFWDATTGLPLGQPISQPKGVWDLAWTPDDQFIVIGSDEGHLYRVPQRRSLLPPWRHEGRVSATLFSPSGTSVLTATDDGVGQLWDTASGKPLGPPLLHNGPVRALGCADGGRAFLTLATRDTSWTPAGGRGEVRLWDAVTGQPVAGPLGENFPFGVPQNQGPITTLAFSDNGQRLFAGSGKFGRVWDVQTGKPLVDTIRGKVTPSPMAIRPDGKVVVAASRTRLQMYDSQSGETIGEEMEHQGNGPLLAVAFSPNSRVLATSAADYAVRLWDGGNGRPLATMEHLQWAHSLAFSPDSKLLLTGSGISVGSVGWGEARLWNIATARPYGKPMSHESAVVAVAFSSDGKRVLTGSLDGTARLWNIETGQPMGNPLAHQGGVVAVAFSPNGDTLATASMDNNARLWDAARGKPIGKLQHDSTLTAIAFSPDGKIVATASRDKTVRRWNVATGLALGKPLSHPDAVLSLAFSPDGKILATGSGNSTSQVSGGFTSSEIRSWNATTGQPINPPLVSPSPYESNLVASPDGRFFLTSSQGTARLWSVERREVAALLSEQHNIHSAVYSPDGRLILTGGSLSTEQGWRATAQLWNASSAKPRGEVLFHFEQTEETPSGQVSVCSVAFRPDGNAFLTYSADTVRVWSTAGKPLSKLFQLPALITGAMFSPDGKLILIRCANDTARLWDAEREQPIGPPLTHTLPIQAMAFSPDGNTVVTASGSEYGTEEKKRSGLLQFWNVSTSYPIGAPLCHCGPVTQVHFRPDGKAVLSASHDQTVRLWRSPGSVAGNEDEVVRWAQIRSGMELGEYDDFLPLKHADLARLLESLNQQDQPLP